MAYGKQLFTEGYGCDACHIVGTGGGIYGPSLNAAGLRLNPGWVYGFIRNPQTFAPRALIPDYGLPPEQAKALSAFVLSHGTPDKDLHVVFHPVARAQDRAIPDEVKGSRLQQARNGKRVYFKHCVMCHAANGGGDGVNAANLEVQPTDFTDVDLMARRSLAELVEVVRDGGRAYGLSVQMPPYGRTLSRIEIQQVASYIRTYVPYTERYRYRKELRKKGERVERPNRDGTSSE